MRFLKSVGVIIIILAVGAVFRAMVFGTPQVTQVAKDETFKNSFVSGCKPELSKYQAVGDPASACGCAYDKLVALYPDFATNIDRMNRITTSGYNSTETDAIVPCVTN